MMRNPCKDCIYYHQENKTCQSKKCATSSSGKVYWIDRLFCLVCNEYDLIDKCPTIDISPIIQKRINENIQEVKERIPPALYDRVSEDLLKDQCCSIWIHCLECITEMADAWEEVYGENLVWVPGHYERKD